MTTYKINNVEIEDLSYVDNTGKFIEVNTKVGKKLDELIKALGTPVKEKWNASKLKNGDEYWYHYTQLDVCWSNWGTNIDIDIYRLKTKNVYQTEEKAEEALKNIISK